MIPDVPLPSAQRAHVAIVSDGEEFEKVLRSLLSGQGYACPLVSSEPDAWVAILECNIDVVFLCVAFDLLGQMEWPKSTPGIVLVNTAAPSWPRPGPGDGYHSPPPSATCIVASAYPTVRVVGALQQFSFETLELAPMGLFDSDAPVVSDDLEAADLVQDIVDQFIGLRPIYFGDIEHASHGAEALRDVMQNIGLVRGHHVGISFASDGGLTIID